MAPYVQLLKVYKGKATFQPQHPDNTTPAAATATAPSSDPTPAASAKSTSPRVLVDVALPASLLEYRVLLLVPQLDAQSYPELLSLLTHLQGCGCELSALLVCCVTAARPALWSVMTVYPTLAMVTAAVDEVRHNVSVPGVRELESRSAPLSNNSQQHAQSQLTKQQQQQWQQY